MSRSIVFSGDEWAIPVVLTQEGVAVDVSSATEIKALISDGDGIAPNILVAEVTLSISATGADWANGIVVAEFTAASTAALTTQPAYIEVQVTLLGKRTTWPRRGFDIRKGLVT